MIKITRTSLFITMLIVGFLGNAYADLSVPRAKQTVLELYITAQQAYEKWQEDPDKIKILDVRTPGEYIFVGHAPMAANIPLRFLADTVNPLTAKPSMPMNENFIEDVKKRYKKTDTLFVMCRSGGRSAASVNLLAKAGFTNVYNIIDGFEGDKVKTPGDPQNGKRVINGWKNSTAPWTYSLERHLAY